MIKFFKILLLLFLLLFTLNILIGCDNNSSSLAMLDNEEEEVDDLLSQAKKFADNSNFSKAKSTLNEARKVGGNSSEYSEVLAYVNRKKDAYNERQRVANQRSSVSNYSGGGSSSSSSSNRLTKVEIYAKLSGVNNNVEAFTVSGSGDIYNNTDHTSIFNRNGVAGRYSYSATIKDYSFMGQTKTMLCSGSFAVSGRKSSVYLTMSPLDCSSYINEY